MSESARASAEAVDRIAILRDPPAPPGYVDPVADSPTLEGASSPEPRGSEATPEAARTNSQP